MNTGNNELMDEYISILLKIDKSMIDFLLSEGQYWRASKKNRVLTQRLKRRGLILKDHRGVWIVNPAFLKLFE
ncbi:MAG: hypothetical protein MPEBLZ_04375 [Candidatus Methanoperedens nitroreducens]|uniref:Uncharacterized protein n=1 Tax=Candidatus Methanoperedens nitratireducens TaxID=1392998 RepID=A0A0P8CF20_9EURY|nr:MAG: hypothetical protein F9K14_03265 [Candidatus Methanoperedens sp.]KPQ41061.1 MAG: hypothetical protein MPEBLZ_04375 [Candidatus Methanoperedens sp. BLZ1]MBZ0175251.1 hypothetical protein [Candidatus Methanoperedens nitroreducens]MCX9076525.1 hypothetical protein [Candidatus Methanoperedens sp.]